MHLLFILANQELEEEKRQLQQRVYKSDFAESCSSTSLSGTILSSTCADERGVPHKTSIDLNNRISNIDGQLKLD
jgi:hypothetical protein